MRTPEDIPRPDPGSALPLLGAAHPHPTWVTDAQGYLKAVNPALLAYCGLSEAELLGRRLWGIVHADDRSAAEPGGNAAPFRTEARLRRHDGALRWFLLDHQPIGQPGAGDGWLVAATDIQSLRARQDDATEQLGVLQRVVDDSTDCIKVLDLTAHLLSMNAGGRRAMEIEDPSACDMAFWPSFWADEGRREVEAALEAARRGETATFEGLAPTARGTPRWWSVTVSPIRGRSGEVERLLAVSRDITEQRLGQQSLSSSQSRLRFALDAAELGTWELDLSDHSSWRSRQHDAIFGYPQGHETWTYETFLEHVLPEDREQVDRKFRMSQQPGAAWEIECRMRRADGAERWIWTRARTLREPDGSERYMLGVVKDITDLKRAEAEVRSLNATLEERVEQRTRALEAQKASLDAFVAYTEAVGTETEPLTLVRQGLALLQTRFRDASAGYYEPEGGLWKARVWTPDIAPEIAAMIAAGVPSQTPLIAGAVQTGQAHFVDGWDPAVQQIEVAGEYGSAAAYPLRVGGRLSGILAVGLRDTRQWSEADRALVRAVGRSLTLALERADQSARLLVQNAELEARSKAMEAFASLTRDLTLRSDPAALIRRAQEVVMSMLPRGHAAYYTLEGTHWQLRSIIGDWGHPELEAVIRQGLPYDRTRNFIPPWTTGQPHYQDVYDPDSDQLGELAAHFAASAVLPVRVSGEPVGLFAVALFDERVWNSVDKAVLQSVVRSLGLAIEGAQSLTHLAQRTRQLERSNRDLEQFAYVASHDLQEPLRTIASFTELLARRYQGQLDANADKYIQYTVDAAQRMRDLIQDLLAYSRVSADSRRVATVQAGDILEGVLRDLAEAVRESGARISAGELPSVQVDPMQFRQLLQNLIGNAIKFRREGVVPEIRISAEIQAPGLHFQVQDNGIGIQPQYFDRIFTVFQRLHPHDRYQGTGVGLAVCRRIVERHGGRLWVESQPGQGSTFHFTLPDSQD